MVFSRGRASDFLRPSVFISLLKTVRMNTASRSIDAFLAQSCSLIQQLDKTAIARACDLLLDCYHKGGRVFTMGNGGSASTAQHFACDLAKFVIPPDQQPFDARCLTDNVSLYTA